jgi:hypothetical protein
LEARVEVLERLITPRSESGSPLASLLNHESGSTEEKRQWLDRELPLIFAMADEDHPQDPLKRDAAVRSRVIRHWRQHLRTRTGAGTAPTSTTQTAPGFVSRAGTTPEIGEVEDLFAEAKSSLRGT